MWAPLQAVVTFISAMKARTNRTRTGDGVTCRTEGSTTQVKKKQCCITYMDKDQTVYLKLELWKNTYQDTDLLILSTTELASEILYAFKQNTGYGHDTGINN